MGVQWETGLPNSGHPIRDFAQPGAWSLHTSGRRSESKPCLFWTVAPSPSRPEILFRKIEALPEVDPVSSTQAGTRVTAPLAVEPGPQSHLAGRTGKNTWKWHNPGTLDPRGGQAEMVTSEQSQWPYPAREWSHRLTWIKITNKEHYWFWSPSPSAPVWETNL